MFEYQAVTWRFSFFGVESDRGDRGERRKDQILTKFPLMILLLTLLHYEQKIALRNVESKLLNRGGKIKRDKKYVPVQKLQVVVDVGELVVSQSELLYRRKSDRAVGHPRQASFAQVQCFRACQQLRGL